MLGSGMGRGQPKLVFNGAAALASPDASQVAGKAPQDISCAWQGEIYNRSELASLVDLSSDDLQELGDPALLVRLYQAYGRSCVEKINGRFAFALYDPAHQEVILGRDRFGIETLYYYDDPSLFVFGSRIAPILAHPAVPKSLNLNALQRFLVFNYNPAWDTFFRGVKKVRPGHLVILRANGVAEERYWWLSFRKTREKSLADYCQDVRELMREAVRVRVQDSDPRGVFLSGGLDSSSVAMLTRELSSGPLYTFSYRCLGKSFDESHYARLMARACGSEHQEVVYHPADICKMESMVELMDEPFCNVGINIATFLLGQAAQGKVSHVLTGDGGDELFGGHPVYAADKVAALFDRIPAVLRRPLMALCRSLPDSDQKLSLTVKLKRFAESLSYPEALGTHRWRVYYGSEELQHVLHPDFAGGADESAALFADVLAMGREADGPDLLSRALYVDFMTEVGFYLRRMDLIRSFQMTPCFPLLDHRLVEYVATIPSQLKFRGLSQPKYIQHQAVQGMLPDEIVHRQDKLGHSIPFKNWLRDEPRVRQFVQQVISDRRLKDRGIVNSDYVHALWEDHQSARQNNSHRLWALTVLELWLTANNL
jgi:asparagine synthase (glutamine-hydrolysing)